MLTRRVQARCLDASVNGGRDGERRTISRVVVDPLSVEDVVHSDNVVVLAHCTTSHSSELLHVTSDTQQQTEVDTERSDVRSRLARDVEHGESAGVVELDQRGRVDGSDSELSLDGRDEGGSLEEGTGEGLECAGEDLLVLERGVQAEDGNVLLSGRLLRFDESGRSVDADDQAAGDLGVERSRVSRLLDSEDSSKPGDNLVRRRVGGLVEVDDTGLDVGGQVPLERAASL